MFINLADLSFLNLLFKKIIIAPCIFLGTFGETYLSPKLNLLVILFSRSSFSHLMLKTKEENYSTQSLIFALITTIFLYNVNWKHTN